ncbi:MAG: universal stress protein [Rhodobacterales bacterium]|nr:MAG: universal stress protein [Rhodobacterales bacterium]
MYKNILVPVAFDEEHETAPALAAARCLAGDGARVTVMHVVEQVPPFALSYMPQGYEVQLQVAIREELAAMAATLPGGTAAVVEGHSGRTILDYASEQGVDCIVIASHRPGMQDYLLGSTAAQVVRHATCSVHVVR